MRLLLAHNLPPWDPRSGGGQRVQHEILCAAVARGHDARALFLGAGPPPPSWDVPYAWYTTAPRRRLVAGAVAMAWRARGVFRSWVPDAVLLTGPEAALVAASLPAGTGLLAANHNPEPADLSRPPSALRSPLASARWARRHQGALLERFALARAHVAIAVSRWGAEVLVARGYVDSGRRLEVVHNGVSSSRLTGDVARLRPEDRSGLLFVGRLAPEKGVDTLLRALALAGGDARLALVGTGPEEAGLRRLADREGVSGRVLFRGSLDPAAVRATMARSAALVLPSRAENFPLVLLEAMASGLPVVATGVGGVPELALNERNALLVPPDDPEALASALGRVLGDPTLRAALAAAGRRTARDYTWDRVTARYLELAEEAHSSASHEATAR